MLRFFDFRSEPAARGLVNGSRLNGHQSDGGDAKRGNCVKNLRIAVGVVGLGLALGGCSADFLRFGSPAFSLNGDKTAVASETAIAPTGSALYDHRSANIPVERSNVASNQGFSDSTYTVSSQPLVERTAPATRTASLDPVNQPIGSRPSTSLPPASYAPMTTGALGAPGETIVVEPGDTLYQLSRRHNVSVAALREANGLAGDVIRPGQTLVVPGAARRRPLADAETRTAAPAIARTGNAFASIYVVRPGDSLYRISRETGVSVDELKRNNDIRDVRALRPGMRLALGGAAVGGATIAAPSGSASAPNSAEVASRIEDSQRSEIKAKPIRTLPIVRAKAVANETAGDEASAEASQPRILNQRSETPIATKPPEKVAMVPPVTAPQSKFRWPAHGRIIASFNHSGTGEKNDGIKISLPDGTDIGAAEEGVVAYAGSELKGYGNLVLVRHDNGWVSAYAHASQILVARGDRVTRGQVIAKAGRSGDVTQPQLHFELRQGAKPVDPLPHMGEM